MSDTPSGSAADRGEDENGRRLDFHVIWVVATAGVILAALALQVWASTYPPKPWPTCDQGHFAHTIENYVTAMLGIAGTSSLFGALASPRWRVPFIIMLIAVAVLAGGSQWSDLQSRTPSGDCALI
jgi:hypothetical protein